MNSTYGLNTYRSNDLSVAMKTSSGDIIKLDFSNRNSSSVEYSKDKNSTKTSMSFSSQQSFKFSIQSNGISPQDKKEIDAFMKTAEPFINNFLTQLATDSPKSPVTKLAKQISDIFLSNKDNTKIDTATIKTNIVKMFDKALQSVKVEKEMSLEEIINKIFKDAQKLLEKTLKEFDKLNKTIYA